MGHALFRKPENHFSGSCLWSKPPLGFLEKLSRPTPERHADLHGERRYADRRLTQDIAFRYRAASRRNIRSKWPKSMWGSRENPKKLNVFAQMKGFADRAAGAPETSGDAGPSG